ncbi:MAG: C-terminal helicase domain-containing protein, partial [Candidatus Omnitrophica bacterium]|nr:C-terminal helicase domain-containing protein [Candidatus Omnitrophota bacterium]
RERRDPVSADTLEIIDTSGNEQAYEHWDRNEEIFYNVAEAEWIVKKAKEFLEKKDNSGKYYQPEDITIVTPYNGQIEYIRQVIDSDFELSLMPDVQARLKKNIITSRQVQGRENRIVLVSFVRSRPGARPQENYHQRYTGLNELPIVADPALLLVSLTRAVEKMAIIGNRETLDQISSDIYGKVFNFIRNRSDEKSVDTPAALPSGDFPDAVLSLAIDQSV